MGSFLWSVSWDLCWGIIISKHLSWIFPCRGYQRPNQAVPGDCGYHLHAHEVEIPNLLNTRKVYKATRANATVIKYLNVFFAVVHLSKSADKSCLQVVKVVAPLPPILQTSYLAEEKGLSSWKLSWVSLSPDNIRCYSSRVISLSMLLSATIQIQTSAMDFVEAPNLSWTKRRKTKCL